MKILAMMPVDANR